MPTTWEVYTCLQSEREISRSLTPLSCLSRTEEVAARGRQNRYGAYTVQNKKKLTQTDHGNEKKVV